MRGAIAVLVLVLLGGAARAENGLEKGYGSQVLLADGVAWTTILVGANYDAKPVWITGASLLVVGAPIVHALHGRSDNAGWSLAVRIGAPLTAGILCGALFPDDKDSFLKFPVPAGMLVGGILGYLTAVIVDSVVIAKDEPMPAARTFSIGGRF